MGIKSLPQVVAVAGLVFMGFHCAFAQDWTLTSAPITNWHAVAVSADGTKVAAVNFSSIYVSTNSGMDWQPSDAPTRPYCWWSSVASSADGFKLVAAATAGLLSPGQIVLSTNFGNSWSAVGFDGAWTSVACSGDGISLAAVYNIEMPGSVGAVWSSPDFGNNWRSSPSGPLEFATSSADGRGLFAAGISDAKPAYGEIWTSANAGSNWTLSSAPNEHWMGIAASADGCHLAAACLGWDYDGGPIYSSADAGVTWTKTGAPKQPWVSVASSADGSRLVAAAAAFYFGAPGPLYTSTDAGATWIQALFPSDKWASVVASADGHRFFAAANEGGIYTCQTTPRPVLNLTPGSSGLLISWIVPSMPFVLQENSDLATTNWTDVTTTPILNFTNLHHELSVPLSITNRFYRLKSL